MGMFMGREMRSCIAGVGSFRIIEVSSLCMYVLRIRRQITTLWLMPSFDTLFEACLNLNICYSAQKSQNLNGSYESRKGCISVHYHGILLKDVQYCKN